MNESERIRQLFFALWDQAKESPEYNKRKWIEFDNILADLVRGPKVELPRE